MLTLGQCFSDIISGVQEAVTITAVGSLVRLARDHKFLSSCVNGLPSVSLSVTAGILVSYNSTVTIQL